VSTGLNAYRYADLQDRHDLFRGGSGLEGSFDVPPSAWRIHVRHRGVDGDAHQFHEPWCDEPAETDKVRDVAVQDSIGQVGSAGGKYPSAAQKFTILFQDAAISTSLNAGQSGLTFGRDAGGGYQTSAVNLLTAEGTPEGISRPCFGHA
jgi:hypothetical protein